MGWLSKAMRAARGPRPRVPAQREAPVTLVVYGWHGVQPGTLSWAFPSLHAAMLAVRIMKNAVRWAIVKGRTASVDIDAARALGLVLAEAA